MLEVCSILLSYVLFIPLSSLFTHTSLYLHLPYRSCSSPCFIYLVTPLSLLALVLVEPVLQALQVVVVLVLVVAVMW